MTAWAHLPNAAHIDAILEDAQVRPKVWGKVWNAVWPTARVEAWAATRAAVHIAGRYEVWYAARNASWDAGWDVARDAVWSPVCTLIAWDDSAAMLDLTPDALRTIISTCDGDVKHQAVLLLPTVIARSTE